MSWKRISAYLGIISGTLFVIVTFIAMAVYPGGYSFFEYPFSALGLTEVDGTPSMLSYYLFLIACTGAAICYVPLMIAMWTRFTETTVLKVVAGIGLIVGLASAPNLSALALFAGNLYPAEHGLTTLLFFILITIGILIYSIAIFLNSEYPQLYGLIGIIVVAICFLYIAALLGFMGTIFGTALWQKVSVYALVLWSAFQGYYLLKVFE
ncbi:MAG: hypothetical protein ACFFEV_04450 [Candidatus Thorarchaeota archaeon]